MACFHLPGGGIGTGPDTTSQRVTVNGKPIYFDFDRRFGPLVTNKRGEPLARQPSEHSPFWTPFNVWLQNWSARNPERKATPCHPSEKWDRK